jgi:ATP-dependent DNA helicase PIF1
MIDGKFFDTLEQVARIVRNNNLPFGGMQVILCGDFLQLPPIGNSNNPDVKFCFEAKSWNNVITETVQLTHIFRQRDPVFIKVLNELRCAKLSPESVRILKDLSRPLKFKDGIEPTQLYVIYELILIYRFCLRDEVDRANKLHSSKLSGTPRIYRAEDSTDDPNLIKKIRDSVIAPDVLELKEGMQVMLIKNMDRKLVNGSLGVLIGFTENDNPIVEFKLPFGEEVTEVIERQEWSVEASDMVLARVQIPLVPSYAMYTTSIS